MKGDIIQISNDIDPADTKNVHTAIVFENFKNGKFEVVDSNYCSALKVCKHVFEPARFAAKEKNYSAHFYRLGDVNLTSFNFPNGSSQGWTCGYSTKELKLTDKDGFEDNFMVEITGNNPGIESPSFSCGLNPDDFIVLVKAGGVSCDFGSNAKIYLKDNSENWNYPVDMRKINPFGDSDDAIMASHFSLNEKNMCPVSNDELFFWDKETLTMYKFTENDYQLFVADLAIFKDKMSEIKQFSIELSNTDKGYWFIDDVILCSKATSWDFKDSALGWTIVSGAKFVDCYPIDIGYWRTQALGKQPRIKSPLIYRVSNDFETLSLRYSVLMDKEKNEKDEYEYRVDKEAPLMNVYFDTGGGIGNARIAQAPITRNGRNQEIFFDIPSDIRGQIIRVYIDLFDSHDYKDKMIAIDRIDFVSENSSDEVLDAYVNLALIESTGEFLMEYAEDTDYLAGAPFADLEDALDDQDDTQPISSLPTPQAPEMEINVGENCIEIKFKSHPGTLSRLQIFNTSLEQRVYNNVYDTGGKICDLYPDTEYTIRACRHNNLGIDCTDKIVVRTLPEGQGECDQFSYDHCVSYEPGALENLYKTIEAIGVLAEYKLENNSGKASMRIDKTGGVDGRQCLVGGCKIFCVNG